MLGTIKSEVRKLLSVRSTYVVAIIVVGLSALVNFYVEGYWGQSGSAAATLQPVAYREIIGNGVGMAALFISIIAVLQMGHEYRHNMITYTLTANARRTQVLLAKIMVIGVFSILAGLFVGVFSIAMYRLGLSLRGADLPPQEFDYAVMALRVAIYSFAYGMVGLLVTILLRNLIGAIVLLLLAPTTVEPLLGLLLKDNTVYLPFSAMDHILGAAMMQGDLTPNAASMLTILYIGVLGTITWLVFVNRDAN